MAVHDPRIVERWRRIVTEWRRSRLSVAAFCRLRQIHKSGFHRWRTILDHLDRSSASPASSARPAAKTSPKPHHRSHPKPKPIRTDSLVPVRVVPDGIVEIVLPSGLQLRLPLSADPDQLARLVKAVTPC